MRRYLVSVIAAAIVVCAASQASAAIYPWEAIDWTGQYVTTIKFINYEVVWNPDTGFKDAAYQPQVNDVVYQLLKATEIYWEVPGSGLVLKWQDSVGDGEITAYAVAKVTDVVESGNKREYTFGPVTTSSDYTDQLGYTWKAEEVVAIYFDTNENFGVNYSTRQQDRESATDGILFATFGFGAAVDFNRGGATGINTELTSTLNLNTGTISSSGVLNVKSVGSSFVDVVFLPIGQYSATFENSVQSGGNSKWPLSSNDPFRIRPTPEPGTLSALLGIVAAGAIGFLRRRRIGA